MNPLFWVLLAVMVLSVAFWIIAGTSSPQQAEPPTRPPSPTELQVRQMLTRHAANTAHHIDTSVTRRRIQYLARKRDSDAC